MEQDKKKPDLWSKYFLARNGFLLYTSIIQGVRFFILTRTGQSPLTAVTLQNDRHKKKR